MKRTLDLVQVEPISPMVSPFTHDSELEDVPSVMSWFRVMTLSTLCTGRQELNALLLNL